MKTIAGFFLKAYQQCVSPYLGRRCRFEPSCSCYSEAAIQKYGFFRGAYLSLRRVLKCQPFHPGGWDPLE